MGKTMKLGFIGTGNMASAIMGGIISNNVIPADEIIGILDNDRINRIYENNLSEQIRIGQYSVRHGMRIPQTNERLKKMVRYMRKGDYEHAYEILRDDHFMLGRDSALRRK